MAIQRVSSKWAKTKVLLHNQHVSPHIPLTKKYSRDSLVSMLGAHPLVYIKPDRGTYGNGVMCVERIEFEVAEEQNIPVSPNSSKKAYRYKFRYGTHNEIYDSLDGLHQAIRSHTHNNLYLIQRGIVMLKHHSRPTDLRILTQKNPSGRWETTGIICRVAAKNKIVTNYHNGGSIAMLNELLQPYMTSAEASGLERKLYELGVRTAEQLQKEYPRLKEIGLDVAIDEDFHPWILEVNTLPAIFPFKKFFKDKSVYRRIEKYAVAYGRLSGKKDRKAGKAN